MSRTPGSTRPHDPAFTLIELLVVVTIIVILIALLTPALDKAVTASMTTKCLSNTRAVTQACLTYATSNDATLPAFSINGFYSSAYDMRALNDPGREMSTGLLVKAKLLPSGNQLGKTVHCPVLDNTADTRGFAFHCMDVDRRGSFVGGSYWFVSGVRVIAGYNYRAGSFFNHTRTDSSGIQKPKGPLKSNKINSRFLIYVDITDTRFASTTYAHPDGYNRSFGDGSGGWFSDPNHYVRTQVNAKTGGQGVQDGLAGYANVEEEMYEYISTRSVAEE